MSIDSILEDFKRDVGAYDLHALIEISRDLRMLSEKEGDTDMLPEGLKHLFDRLELMISRLMLIRLLAERGTK